jgi:adenylate cyclase
MVRALGCRGQIERAVTSGRPPGAADESFWRDFLARGDPRERAKRGLFKRIPSDPRCRICAAPFSGIGAPIMRLIGKQPSNMNPNWCATCFTFLSRHHGGAEIELTMLFADIRGSTRLAESMPTAEYRALLDRFYSAATEVIVAHDGGVDKFVGDEVVALFFPLLTGERHAARAVDAARALMVATGHADPAGPWVALGAGHHTGVAWVGAVGEGAHTELTAVGDAVNVAARVASAAAAGEILISVATASAAGLDGDLERRSLELKGKEGITEVVAVSITPSTSRTLGAASGDRGLVVEDDLDERAPADHRIDIVAAPGGGDRWQDRPTLGLVVDDPCPGGEIGPDHALEMKRHPWIGLEVAEPGTSAIRSGHTADVDPTAEVVEHDLDPAGKPGPATGRRDVDQVAARERTGDPFVHGVRRFLRG